jgi:hypothetical protein
MNQLNPFILPGGISQILHFCQNKDSLITEKPDVAEWPIIVTDGFMQS